MKQLVAACDAELGGVGGRKMLDVGCNDSSLLSVLTFKEHDTQVFGIELTGAADAREGGHKVIRVR